MLAADVGQHIDARSDRIIGVERAIEGDPGKAADLDREIPLAKRAHHRILDAAGAVEIEA